MAPCCMMHTTGSVCLLPANSMNHRLVHRSRLSVRVSAAIVASPPTTAAANRVKLGDSDLLVSECCLGTMTWGRQNTEADAHEQLSYAADAGINFMDTAEMYPVPTKAETQGRTDQYIGTWLKDQRREDIILATKVCGYSTQATYLRGEPTRVTPGQIAASVDASLQRLRTDYIDLLQIHWPDRYVSLFGGDAYEVAQEREGDVPFEVQLRGLESVIRDGKVRYIGVSNETSYGVMSFVRAAEMFGLPKIVSIQNCYSLLVRGAYETDLAEVCAPRQCNVGLLAYSPLAGGILTGKYTQPQPDARLSLFPGFMDRYKQSLAREAVAEYCRIAAKYGLTPAELSLAWCRQNWRVTSTIIGATSMAHLKENIGAFDKELSPECSEEIEAVYKRYRDPAMR